MFAHSWWLKNAYIFKLPFFLSNVFSVSVINFLAHTVSHQNMQIKQKEEYLAASCKIGSIRMQGGWPLGAQATETIRKRKYCYDMQEFVRQIGLFFPAKIRVDNISCWEI